MKQNNINKIKFVGPAIAALLAVGCQTDESSITDFFPDEEVRSTQNFMTAQAAAGARADATLRTVHFDGDHLNSLGEAKLDLLLKDDDSSNMVVVYMDVPQDDENLKARRDAVVTYFEDRGVTKDSIEFKAGSNPGQTSLAAEHLNRLSKTESDGSAADADAQAGTGTSTAGAGEK